MKEARSVATAVFLFAVFLLVYGFFVPGHAHGARGPRFVRMQVEDGSDHVTMSVPYAFVDGALRLATGRMRRELECHFGESVEAGILKGIVAELKTKPDGTPVSRTHDGDDLTFRKEGDLVSLEVSRSRTPATEEVEEAGTEAAATDEDESDEAAAPKPAPPTPPDPAATPAPEPERVEKVTVRFPFRLLEATASSDHDLDVDALLSELRSAPRGDLVDVKSRDAHVRVWVE